MVDFNDATVYAVVVPGKIIPSASRVPEPMRQPLNIDLDGVEEDGRVRRH
jgi:hypothetical protein